MAEALQLHRQGRLAQAEPLYRQVLAVAPRHAEALHMLGMVALQQRRFHEADRLIAESLAISPDSIAALNNRAGVLQALGRLDEALTSYDKALALRPDFAQALNNRGNVLKDLGRSEEALASYDGALAIRPDYAEALNNRAVALGQLGRCEAALASCDQALAIKPEYPEALNNRGNALHELGRVAEALACYDRAFELKPGYVDALNNRGNALLWLRRVAEALVSFDRALELKPDHAEALNNRGTALRAALTGYDQSLSADPNHVEALHNRGNALLGLRRLEEALASYDRALAIKPDYAEALNNRAHVLYQLWRPEEALASCDKVAALRPEYAEGLSNRGVVLQALGNVEEALASYAAAVAVRPDFAHAHFNEALCRLSVGDFATGWEKYEWRWRLQYAVRAKRDFAMPLWLGEEDLTGKTVFLHAEQGFGDTLQFCRYAPAVAAKGATVILEVPAPLKSLLRTLPGIEHVVSEHDPSRPFDFHCPLMSLPLAFGTRVRNHPGAGSLSVGQPVPGRGVARASGAARRDQGRSGLGGKRQAGQPRRSADRPAALDAPAADVAVRRDRGCDPGVASEGRAGVADPPAAARLGHPRLDRRAGDFADTAALIAALDLVISVDTSVAHLAGALGKPVWVLNRHDRCWRWLLDREDTPWYPTMRLFTQPRPGDWASVVRRVSGELRNFASDRLTASTRDPSRLAPGNRFSETTNTAAELVAGIRSADRRLDCGSAFPASRLTE